MLKIMNEIKDLQIELKPYREGAFDPKYDVDQLLFDLESDLDLLSSHADSLDYLVSIASGMLCSVLDILWVGEFSLEDGRAIASDKVDDFVIKTARMLGCKKDSLVASVRFLEKTYPLASDGNTANFGGGLQHHLRDFSHHPTIVGLMFSLLTQFSNRSYGTDTRGFFTVVDVPNTHRSFIGTDVQSKISMGTLNWFFHLVSDVAGSSGSVTRGGGTGIPGPIVSLAKEISVLPFFKNMSVKDNSLSVFISKLFNGTLLAKHDEKGLIIKDTVLKFDLRGELGLGIELGKQAVPIVANECIIRTFYFIRRLGMAIRSNEVQSLSDMKLIDWDSVKPHNNPTIARMLTLSTAVFTSVDIGASVLTQKFWVSINYMGVGRFAMAIGEDLSWCLKTRDLKRIIQVYEDIKRFSYTQTNNKIYERMDMDMEDKFGLTLDQTEILYNIEYYKTFNDIKLGKQLLNKDGIKNLKTEWLEEWKSFISEGYASFLGIEGAEIHWYSKEELQMKIEENQPQKTWFRLVMLEAMLFEPYYSLGVEQNENGKTVESKKYKHLQLSTFGYSKKKGDLYLDAHFTDKYYNKGYVSHLRNSYNKVTLELNEVLKGVLKAGAVTTGIAIVTVITAGALSGPISIALVGSNFAGLSGAALTSASLAYLGGGAIALGGFGMVGGTAVIVGGGALLGISAGVGVGGAVGVASLKGKKYTVSQSAKLLVSVREIFLNDEKDIEFSNSVYEQYLKNIIEIENGLTELRLKADVTQGIEKKELKKKIKQAEESVEAMKIARKNLLKFKSSFEIGLKQS